MRTETTNKLPHHFNSKQETNHLKIFSPLMAAMAGGVLLCYYLSGQYRFIPSWGTTTLFILLTCRILTRRKITNTFTNCTILTSYLMLSIVGLCAAWSYSTAYDFHFSPYGDDSYYFLNVTDLANNVVPEAFTLFEVLMALVYSTTRLFTDDVGVLHLLPVNWAIGAFSVGLSVMLAQRIGGRNFLLAPAVVLLNYHFVDACIHFYRDGLVLLLILLCMHAAADKRFILATCIALLTGLIRGGNGMLCLFFVIMFAIAYSKNITHFNIKTIGLGICFVAAFIVLDYSLQLGGLGRSFMGNQGTSLTLIERASYRAQSMLGERESGYSSITLLYGLGPLGLLLIPLAATFTPMRGHSLVFTLQASVRGNYIGIVDVVRPAIAFMFTTILLWPIVGPRLLSALTYRSRVGSVFGFVIKAAFITTVLSIGLVSFQSRHRTAFVIFFPALLALAEHNPKKGQLGLSMAFAGLILAANLLPYLLGM